MFDFFSLFPLPEKILLQNWYSPPLYPRLVSFLSADNSCNPIPPIWMMFDWLGRGKSVSSLEFTKHRAMRSRANSNRSGKAELNNTIAILILFTFSKGQWDWDTYFCHFWKFQQFTKFLLKFSFSKIWLYLGVHFKDLENLDRKLKKLCHLHWRMIEK